MSSVKKKILIVGGKSKLAKNFMFFLKKKNIKFLYTEKKHKNKILYLNLRNVKSFKIPNNITSAVFFAYKSNINYVNAHAHSNTTYSYTRHSHTVYLHTK